MFDTKFYKNRWRPLSFRPIWFFYFFFIVTSHYKNLMYPQSFLCAEAKIKQRTPLKKQLCEIGEEAIWESRFTSFLLSILVTLKFVHSTSEHSLILRFETSAILKFYCLKFWPPVWCKFALVGTLLVNFLWIKFHEIHAVRHPDEYQTNVTSFTWNK